MPTLTTTSASFRIEPRGHFSLAAGVRFLWGFTPAAYHGPRDDGHLHLAFNGRSGPLAVCLQQRADGAVEGAIHGGEPEGAREQVARILSLDVDGTGWAGVGQRDEVIGRLQRATGYLRPVLWSDPYEAACWAIISTRISMGQAARVKERIAVELGSTVLVHGHAHHVFPSPEALLASALELGRLPQLFGRKPEYLAGVARAAAAGRLDAERLRGMPAGEAISEVAGLPGIGPSGAELVVLRGAGEPDWMPSREPRVLAAVAAQYGLPDPPSTAAVNEVSDRWRPYRTWASVLLRAGQPVAPEGRRQPRSRAAGRR